MLHRSAVPMPEHTIRDRHRQSGFAILRKPPTPQAAAARQSVRDRFGDGALARGFTSCPNLLLEHYRTLGLTDQELVFLLQLLTYWWGEDLPHPALGTVADRMGKSVRQVHTYVERLRARGLLVVQSRRAPHGGQLTNQYDFTPLLHALDALGAPACADNRSEEGMHGTALEGVKPAAPKGDEPRTNNNLDSMTPTPVALRRDEVNEPLEVMLAVISADLGDEAMGSSLARAKALMTTASLSWDTFRPHLEDARRRTLGRMERVRGRRPQGRPNAMPYFFAVLERLLLPNAPHAHRRGKFRRDVPTFSTPPLVPAETDPVWGALLTELRGMVAPALFTDRLLRTKVRSRAEHNLEVEAEDVSKAQWLTHMLRRTLGAAKANLGLGDLTVSFVASGT